MHLIDFRAAWRRLRREPGFAALVVAILAISLGGTTAMFSLVNAMLLQPLPYGDAKRLVLVGHRHDERGEVYGAFSPPDYDDLAARSRSIESSAAFLYWPGQTTQNAIVGDRPEQLESAIVTGAFFTTLDAQARLGRVLLPADDVPGNDVVVLSDRAWRTLFGADPGIVGRDVTMKERPFRVVGVMPPEFDFPDARVQVWAPRSIIGENDIPTRRDVRWLDVVARLAPGVSMAAATQEVDAIIAGIAAEHADTNEHFTHGIVEPLFERVVGPTRAPLTALFAATGLVLLIACGNLANLLLARAQKRERELVTRSALGAAPARLGAQLVAETLVLTLAGAALGALFAKVGLDAWLRGLDTPIARQSAIGLDWTVLAFGAVVALACALGIGLVPAWRARRIDPARVLSRGGSPTAGVAHARIRAVLVVAQVALVCALGYTSTLAVESLRRVLAVDSGVDAARVLSFNVRVDGPRYEASGEALIAGQRAILDALRAIPGVVAVGGSKNAAIGQTGEGYSFTDKARPDQPMRPDFGLQFVSHDYFRALGVPFERGRDFTGEEGPDDPMTIIVNEAFVDRWYPGQDVVGKHLMLGDSEVEVVGVVEDIRHGGLREGALPAAYAPNNQVVRSSLTVSIRTNGPVPDLVARARDAVWSVDARLPITGMRWLDEELARMEAQPRLVATLLSAFAVLSALIGGLGVFSLLAYVVGERRRELAVRLAIGASPARLLGVVVGQAARLAVAGIAVGLPLGVAAAQLLGTQLFDTQVVEPWLLAALGGATLVLCALAAIAPGATALRTEPMQVLRQE